MSDERNIPRGTYAGREEPADEAARFYHCERCGDWVDSRDLADILLHEGPHRPEARH